MNECAIVVAGILGVGEDRGNTRHVRGTVTDGLTDGRTLRRRFCYKGDNKKQNKQRVVTLVFEQNVKLENTIVTTYPTAVKQPNPAHPCYT